MVDESGQAEDQPVDASDAPEMDSGSAEPSAESAPASVDAAEPVEAVEAAESVEETAEDAVVDEADSADASAEAADEDPVDSEIRPEDLYDPDEDDDDEDEYVGDVAPIEEELDEEEPSNADYDWYILKVQSNREKSICAGLQRRVSVAGLDELFKEIIVPTEGVAEFKNGKRRVVKRKLYPGYIVVNMLLNDETWFLVRDTPGIGDFTGAAGKPTPMLPEEVDRIVKAVRPDEDSDEQIKTAIPFKPGDRVRIKEGTFENFEGDVEGIDEGNGRVTVTINIFGRSTPVELEHWQIENV